MVTFRFRKLVRDNIWQWHEEAGHTVAGEQLTDQRLRHAMADKLHEEAEEVRSAGDRSALIEELADMQQLLDDMSELQGVSQQEVQAAQRKKRLRKGGFAAGHFIETVTMPDEDDKWANYCRQSPEKYPEISASTGQAEPELPELEAGRYLHTKTGREYEVIDVGMHTETETPLVIYKPLYESRYRYFIRPYGLFVGSAEIDGVMRPRFQKVREDIQSRSGAAGDA